MLLALIAGVAMAQSANKIYAVYIGGYQIMRLRAGTKELTLPERRQIVQQRATNLMKCVVNGEKAKVKAVPSETCTVKCVRNGNDWDVVANGMRIVTVTSLDAKANNTTTYKQAKLWADTLRKTFPKAAANCAEGKW